MGWNRIRLYLLVCGFLFVALFSYAAEVPCERILGLVYSPGLEAQLIIRGKDHLDDPTDPAGKAPGWVVRSAALIAQKVLDEDFRPADLHRTVLLAIMQGSRESSVRPAQINDLAQFWFRLLKTDNPRSRVEAYQSARKAGFDVRTAGWLAEQGKLSEADYADFRQLFTLGKEFGLTASQSGALLRAKGAETFRAYFSLVETMAKIPSFAKAWEGALRSQGLNQRTASLAELAALTQEVFRSLKLEPPGMRDSVLLARVLRDKITTAERQMKPIPDSVNLTPQLRKRIGRRAQQALESEVLRDPAGVQSQGIRVIDSETEKTLGLRFSGEWHELIYDSERNAVKWLSSQGEEIVYLGDRAVRRNLNLPTHDQAEVADFVTYNQTTKRYQISEVKSSIRAVEGSQISKALSQLSNTEFFLQTRTNNPSLPVDLRIILQGPLKPGDGFKIVNGYLVSLFSNKRVEINSKPVAVTTLSVP